MSLFLVLALATAPAITVPPTVTAFSGPVAPKNFIRFDFDIKTMKQVRYELVSCKGLSGKPFSLKSDGKFSWPFRAADTKAPEGIRAGECAYQDRRMKAEFSGGIIRIDLKRSRGKFSSSVFHYRSGAMPAVQWKLDGVADNWLTKLTTTESEVVTFWVYREGNELLGYHD